MEEVLPPPFSITAHIGRRMDRVCYFHPRNHVNMMQLLGARRACSWRKKAGNSGTEKRVFMLENLMIGLKILTFTIIWQYFKGS
jgi:hypothetical protein